MEKLFILSVLPVPHCKMGMIIVTSYLIENCGKSLNRHFTTQHIQVAKIQKENALPLWSSVQPAMRHHYIPRRRAKIKKTNKVKSWWRSETTRTLIHGNWVQYCPQTQSRGAPPWPCSTPWSKESSEPKNMPTQNIYPSSLDNSLTPRTPEFPTWIRPLL